MASSKDEKLPVVTYADHKVITPPQPLRKAIMTATDPHDDPVARAEAALAQLSSEFAGWMQSECDRLEAARGNVKRHGFNKTTHDELFRTAHDIRGHAATFGYPEAGGVADTLCRLVEHTPDMTRIPIELVDQHVDAVRAIVRDHGRVDRSAIADELTRRLRDVTDEFVRSENRDRPDLLESIFGPPLVP
jgi:chemotaxis protein histidine kinase CheA